ncbi:MAG TPA: enoyl-CoA hydratase-related protein [Saprospiraceae bacterium]|nr:enoyl-CoA hydratase-related protein [Saprospiraceae bacterium]
MSLILKSQNGGVMTLTLNRPEVYNSFNQVMALALQDAISLAGSDKSVRCIVITGAGKAFCAGQDLNEVVDPKGPPLQEIVGQHFNPIIWKIRDVEKPFIAAVNGVAAGAGANIALACDIAVAKSSASFIQSFSKIGLIPDSGGTFTLPRLIGFQRATALMMLGEKVTAPDAEKMGMIYKCIEDGEFDDYIITLATQLSQMPTRGLGLTKRALNASTVNDLYAQLSIEEELQFAAGNTLDYQEGVKAFLEKRKPEFKGE